jgi:hypothetical protein
MQLDLLSYREARKAPPFDGETYEAEHDEGRLRKQFHAVFLLMHDSQWRTLEEIAFSVYGQNDPDWRLKTNGVSARLRDCRKEKFGGHTVERQRRGDPKAGLFEYRLIVNEA